MAIPLQADRRPNEDRADDYLRTVNSRIAGGGKHARADPPRVSLAMSVFKAGKLLADYTANFPGHR